ncbi:MAG: dUTP diphosphatase [Sulfurovum sp.]
MNKVLQMLKLQQKLNDTTNGKDWEEGFTKNNKPINWKRCIYIECTELIESYPWKHWKDINAQPDYDNIKIEVVDIWHFIMSQGLKEYKRDNKGTIGDLAQMITNLPNFALFKDCDACIEEDIYTQMSVIELLIKDIFCEEPIEKILEVFLAIAIQSKLNLNALYQLYIGKNILNQFRQDHGYKDGTYNKFWDGEEDNAIMQNILALDKNITPDGLYKVLKTFYERT